jgi:predicted ATPase
LFIGKSLSDGIFRNLALVLCFKCRVKTFVRPSKILFMLERLDIEHFRCFDQLSIEGLKRVNLFVGKNNTGKTALLEALRIMASDAHVTVVNHVLEQRGELMPGREESYDHLFNRQYIKQLAEQREWVAKIGSVAIKKISDNHSFKYVFLIENGSSGSWGVHVSPDFPKDNAVYVPFSTSMAFPMATLWDKIALTDDEDAVIQILQETILPDILRLDVKEGRTLVRLSGEKTPVPLKSMGEGAQRILQLAIALVSARSSLLLIDELEAGLHHTLLETLWEKIFHYARLWDIQVFVTTHSQDVVRKFTYTVEQGDNREHAAFFRLQENRKSKTIEAVSYDAEQLELVLETKLEVR